jgi:hypothetical protein
MNAAKALQTGGETLQLLSVRILVVDDFEPWRHFVFSLLLQKKPELQVVGEASDGSRNKTVRMATVRAL